MTSAIEFADVTKSYGRVPALDGLNLVVPAGEICGFLGPNGAGKTTAIRLLIDLIRPDAGHATILGIDCQRDGVEARKHLGYLPGELHLYDNYTAREMLELLASVRGVSAVSYMSELCERLNLDPTKKLASLSKGNKQKAGIVLALMHRPEVIVLDEPTSGLDPLIQEEVEQILKEFAAGGRTVFFSSHVLSEVERLCQRVAILRKGRLVAVEDVTDLKGRSLHIIEVTFAGPVPVDALAGEGVTELRRDGNTVHLQVRTNLDSAIKAIARFPVVDLRTEQPSLEDVFLAYYHDPDADAAGSDESL